LDRVVEIQSITVDNTGWNPVTDCGMNMEHTWGGQVFLNGSEHEILPKLYI
jgi:hypothetical protein